MYRAPSVNLASSRPRSSRPGCDGLSNGTGASPGQRPLPDCKPETRGRRLFTGPRRDRIVVAGIRRHRLANLWMRREERAEVGMLLRVAVVVDQRRIVGDVAR